MIRFVQLKKRDFMIMISVLIEVIRRHGNISGVMIYRLRYRVIFFCERNINQVMTHTEKDRLRVRSLLTSVER